MKIQKRLEAAGWSELWRDPLNGKLLVRHAAINVFKSRNKLASIDKQRRESVQPSPDSFPTMEVKATVALDGDTRRCCNNPDCNNDDPCAIHGAAQPEAGEARCLGYPHCYVSSKQGKVNHPKCPIHGGKEVMPNVFDRPIEPRPTSELGRGAPSGQQETSAAAPSAEPLTARAALKQWEIETGHPANASEGIAFMDGFNAADAFAAKERERADALQGLVETYLGRIAALTAERAALFKERYHAHNVICSAAMKPIGGDGCSCEVNPAGTYKGRERAEAERDAARDATLDEVARHLTLKVEAMREQSEDNKSGRFGPTIENDLLTRAAALEAEIEAVLALKSKEQTKA